MLTVAEAAGLPKLRQKLAPLVGKRVVAGLTSDHYVCGLLESLTDDDALFRVGDRPLRLPLTQILLPSEAAPWQADFFK